MRVYHFKQKRRITLYDSRIHKEFSGTLIFHPDPLSEFMYALAKATDSFSIPKLQLSSIYLKKISMALFALAMAGVLYTSLPIVLSSVQNQIQLHTQSVNIDKNISQRLNQVYQQASVPPPPKNINDFTLSIPKIGLTSSVIPEVDPTDQKAYDKVLKVGVAQASGSYLPGQGGLVYLFSHSTDSLADIAAYNAKFFYLKDLKIGDDVYIQFEGAKYHYRITDRQIIDPSNIAAIQHSKADLILATCYPPGTDWQRLVLSAIQLPT